MSKRNAKDNVTTPDREGQRLAIVMLRELEASPELCDKSHLAEAWSPQPGPAQDNIVLRYLEQCRKRGRDVEAGFCSVLSDIVATTSEDFCPSANTYTRTLKIRVPGGRVSARAKKLRVLKGIGQIIGRPVTEQQLDAAAERIRSHEPA